MLFDDLGFAADYSVDTELEYPGDGNWGFPEFRVRANGSSFGGPRAIIRPTGGEAWVLVSDLSDIGAIYATPNPRMLCLVDRFSTAITIDVDDPADQTVLDVARPMSVAGAPDVELLFIGDDARVTAFGLHGLQWQSEALFDDDLRIRRTDNERVLCRGWNYTLSTTAPIEVTLDAHTGEVIAGLTARGR